jgi:hypothetical protein
LAQLLRRHFTGTLQICASQVCGQESGSAEPRPGKIGPAKDNAPQLRLAQIRVPHSRPVKL